MSLLYEYNSTYTPGGGGVFYINYWLGQSWTVGSVGTNTYYTIDYVSLRFYREGGALSGTITVSIRETSASGLPIGSDLCSGTMNLGSITNSSTVYNINMTPAFIVNTGTKYAIIVRTDGGTFDNPVIWDVTGTNTYAGGSYMSSSNSGASWNAATDFDFYFGIYGTKIYDLDVVSLPIDYNNRTITHATLTGTSTGTVSYWMSANGGTKWNGCSSGVPCTFTSSGTNLIWKAAGTTGSIITKIEVTNYH